MNKLMWVYLCLLFLGGCAPISPLSEGADGAKHEGAVEKTLEIVSDGGQEVVEEQLPEKIREERQPEAAPEQVAEKEPIKVISYGCSQKKHSVCTIAGSVEGYQDGKREQAWFSFPDGIAVAADGTMYVSDSFNHRIRKIDVDGVVTTYAGTGTPGYKDGDRLVAQFDRPGLLALDPQGNLYVADQLNFRIRKIDLQGNVSTYAGVGLKIERDGPALQAGFPGTAGMVFDKKGNLYLSDASLHTIRKIDTSKNVSTIAGVPHQTGKKNGLARQALFSSPAGLAIDSQGALLIAERTNHAIRKLDTAGVVTTIAGGNGYGDVVGDARQAKFHTPLDVMIDAGGNIYVVESGGHQIKKLNKQGMVSRVAGGRAGFADGEGDKAQFYSPQTGAYVRGGLLVVDRDNHRIRRIALPVLEACSAGETTRSCYTGAAASVGVGICRRGVQTCAGGYWGECTGEITPKEEECNNIDDDCNGKVDDQIQKVNACSKQLGVCKGAFPSISLCVDGKTASCTHGDYKKHSPHYHPDYDLCDTYDNNCDGVVERCDRDQPFNFLGIYAGNGQRSSVDGTLTRASFDNPSHLALGPNRSLYVMDAKFIRKMEKGQVTTLFAHGLDYTRPFTNIYGMVVDSKGQVYIATSEDYIYRYSPNGQRAPVLIPGKAPTLSLGSPPFLHVLDMKIDAHDNIYLTRANRAIRSAPDGRVYKLTPSGDLSLVVGGQMPFSLSIPLTLSSFSFALQAPSLLDIGAPGVLYSLFPDAGRSYRIHGDGLLEQLAPNYTSHATFSYGVVDGVGGYVWSNGFGVYYISRDSGALKDIASIHQGAVKPGAPGNASIPPIGRMVDDKWGDVYFSVPKTNQIVRIQRQTMACQAEGTTRSCYTGPPHTSGVGICQSGTQRCLDGRWTLCVGQTLPRKPAFQCDGKDNDCDGTVDVCPPYIRHMDPRGWSNQCSDTVQVHVYGANFLRTSTVAFGSQVFTSQTGLKFVDSTHLTFPLVSSSILPGTIKVSVNNGASLHSNTYTFYGYKLGVAGGHKIQRVYPTSFYAGQKYTITIENLPTYQAGARVFFGGKELPTRCSTPPDRHCDDLRAELDLSDIQPGVYSITVKPACGIASAPFLIHVEKAPKPTVFRIAPSFVKVGEKKHLTIHGWGFDKKHKLVLDGKVVPTVWRSSDQLETKNAVDFTAKQPGQIELYVENDGAIKGTTAKIEVVAKQSTHHISFVSLHSLRTNTIHSDIYLYGGPWSKNAKVFLENNAINANFVSSSILHIKTLSTKGFVPGSLGFVVKDGSVVSHRYHVMLGHGPFSVEVVSPSEGVYLKGTIALSLSAVGEGCGIANVTGSCLEPFEIEFVGPDNVDYGTAGKKKFRLLSSSSYRDGSYQANGNLDTIGLPLGLYKVRFVLKTGRKSTAGLFQLTAGPAPTLYSAAPNIVFPTGTNRITLQGKDFPPGALVLFGKTFIQPSYTTNSEIRFEIPKSALQVGVYQVRVRTPQQQLSNAVSVEVLSPQPPAIYNAYPFIMSAGLVVPQLSIKAESFDSQTQVTLNGVAVPASQLTFQQGMIHVRDIKIPTGGTVGKLQLVNKNGLTSNTFDLLIHDKPYILHITPSLLSPQASPHQVSVFGYGFAPNASLLINGKKLAGAKVEWNRVTFPQNGGVGLVTPLDVDIQVQNPNGLTSNTLKITKVSSSYRPIIERGSISGSSIFAVEAGKSLLQRRTLTLHGQGFTTFTKLYFDGKPLVTSSTSTSITVLESLDFRKSSLGWKSFQAVEGTQKSNRFILPISSPFYLGTFPQVDPIAPFIARLNQSTTLYMKIQDIHSAQDAFQYDVVVKNAGTIGAGKILPLVFQGGSTCRVVLNATGWQKGLYTLFVRSKNNHKVISGGTGLYVVP